MPGLLETLSAALTTSEAQCEGFADALHSATRDLMAEMEKNVAVIRAAGGFRMFEDSSRLQPGTSDALTLDELRPIFRKIIGQ